MSEKIKCPIRVRSTVDISGFGTYKSSANENTVFLRFGDYFVSKYTLLGHVNNFISFERLV